MTDLFDREIRALFDQSIEILNTRYSVSGALGKGKKELMCLNRYKSIYHAMNPSDFHDDFKRLYKKKKTQILKSLDSDGWIKNGEISIQFCEGVKDLGDKCADMKIMLSNIYQCALDLQDNAQKTLEELSPELVSTISNTNNKDLIRPSIILLHLMRIFYAIGDEEDKLQLSSIIETLETDLSVKNRTIKPLQLVSESKSSNINTSGVAAGLSGLFNMVTDVLKQVGVAIPEEVQAPSEEQFSEIIHSFANNQGIKTVFQGIAQTMNNGGDINTMAQSAFQNLLKPEMLQSMQSSILQTAEIAKENSLAEKNKAASTDS